MDIELTLREKLVLQDPGPRFTDGVMARVGNAPVGQFGEGVVRLSDARVRQRSRRILLATLVVMGAAAAMPAWYLSNRAKAQVVGEAVASPQDGMPSADLALQKQAGLTPQGTSQSPKECVDPDVLRGLLLGVADETFHISDAYPPELTAFRAPRQLTWLGSSGRGNNLQINGASTKLTSVAAVFRTDLGPDAARTATVGALITNGWKLQSDGRQYNTGVFTSASSRPISETYCREGNPLTVDASALDGVTYVVLQVSRQSNDAAGLSNACNQPPPVVRPAATLDNYMPKLELPRDPSTGNTVTKLGGGNSSGEGKRRSYATFTLMDSADSIGSHFARQLLEQGWTSEASWSGDGTTGSTWRMRTDADSVLQGMLVVSALEAGRFTVVFNVVSTK